MFKRISKAYRSLHLLSGEDYRIIQALNNQKINRNFNIIGFCVLVISLLCLFSAGIFMFNIFDGVGKLMSVPIGIFWGFTITTIYILLLYTITPPLLRDRTMIKRKNRKISADSIILNNAKKITDWLTFSMFLRLAFILVFAVIIAQPFNVLFFGKLIKPDIETYKMRFKAEMILNSDSFKIAEEQKLHAEFYQNLSLHILSKSDSIQALENLTEIDKKIKTDLDYLLKSIVLKNSLEKLENNFDKKAKILKEYRISEFSQLAEMEIESDLKFTDELKVKNFSNPELQLIFKVYSENVKSIIDEKNAYNLKTTSLIDGNNFYLRQIIMLNQNTSAAKVSNLCFLLLFVLPIYLKFQIRKVKPNVEEVFYKYKEKFEREIVTKNYENFKINFGKTLTTKNAIAKERFKISLQESLNNLEKYKPQTAATIRRNIEERYDRTFNYYEKYLDPPFNLKDKKKNIVEISEQSFIDDVWKTEEV